MVLIVIGAVMVGGAVRLASTGVVAEANLITIRNHLRSTCVPVDEIVDVGLRTKHFRWGKQPYSSPWNGPKDLLVGVIELRSGEAIACDALLGLPPAKDWAGRTAPEIKTQTLARWVAATRPYPLASHRFPASNQGTDQPVARLVMRAEVGAESPLWQDGAMVALDTLGLPSDLQDALTRWAAVGWEGSDEAIAAQGRRLYLELVKTLGPATEVLWDND